MSIPIIDINSGDTISSMVDKINYNFTLLSLKGGGPAGIQGIQGIRGLPGLQGVHGIPGPAGASIHAGEPPTEQGKPGDIYISDGVIQQVQPTGQPVVITNLHDAVDSPFGIDATGEPTINPHNDYVDYGFVLGASTEQTELNVHAVINHPAKMHFFGIDKDYIHFYNGFTKLAEIKATGSNKFCISGDTIAIGKDVNSMQFDENNITINSRKITGSQYANTYFVLGTNENGQLDKKQTEIIGYNFASKIFSVFPVSASEVKNNIGYASSILNYNNRIDNIYLNGGSAIQFNETIDGNSPKYFSIISDTNNHEVMRLSQNGISLGGFKNKGYSIFEHTDLGDSFGLFITTPDYENSILSGPVISMSSKFDTQGGAIISGESLTVENSSNNVVLNPASPNFNTPTYLWNVHGINHDQIKLEKCSNLITADKNQQGTLKQVTDILHIHGANDMSGAGCDVVISGGNTFSSSSFTHVGGDVYICGGSAMKSNGEYIMKDNYRSGNVIIGINPLHHSELFNESTYTSKGGQNRNTETNPEGVAAFDVNNVAIHANRIVIDSNANQRKKTNGYSNVNSTAPYAKAIENTTIQMSGINTLKHHEPILLEQKDICSHQFVSGVMTRILRMQYVGNSMKYSYVNPDDFYKQYNKYTRDDANGSVYFFVDEVWQKVGNIVNVKAFGRWLANRPGQNDDKLYHISDYMFSSNNSHEITTYWFNKQTCYNATLGYLLTRPDNTQSTAKIRYNDITANQDYLQRQPITAFVLPISIKDSRATFCYGTGNIYTECAYNAFLNIDDGKINYTQTNSLIYSSPVMVGGYHDTGYANDADLAWGHMGYTPNNFYGSNSALHEGWQNTEHLTGRLRNKLYPSSNAMTHSDSRLNLNSTSQQNACWSESKFKTIEPIDNQSNYIYPEMLVNYGNNLILNESGNIDYNNHIGLIMRPCAGLYTWISLDYSYNIMNGFDGLTDTYEYVSISANTETSSYNIPISGTTQQQQFII